MPPFLTDIAAKLLGAVALCALGFVAGWEVKGAFDAKAQLAAANATVKAVKHEVAVAQQLGAAGQAQADQDAGAFAKAQTQIQTVTRTLTKEIPVFIAPNPVPSAQEVQGSPSNENVPALQPVVIYGVPCGLVRIYDASATGNTDLASLPICAGESDDTPSSVTMSELANVLIQNNGAFEGNREQVIALQDWARQIQLWYADVKQKLESGK